MRYLQKLDQMSSDDEANELAKLRAQRAARTGAPATLSELRDKQRRIESRNDASAAYFQHGQKDAAVAGPSRGAAGGLQEDEVGS